ncbi:hypothetical protein GSI_05632 [Ganoderma sinense ZZ0214-1]|uniref:DUF6534 domain-containing protein n=1 Tax=Ganoderma sinense ZZ0214-1 TaxID=1077348 RepID=A0A2G8SF36_9APHY|nr:hypothetical protein GSI_05632 [Ganoderma sinense ZZ0214-1]
MSSTLVPLTSAPSLDSTFGAVLIGTFFGLMLYPRDSGWIKALVFSTLLFETAHIVLSIHVCYYYLVTKYGNSDAIQSSVWSLGLLSAMTGLIVVQSQGFFAGRIFRQLGFFCAATAEAIMLKPFSEFQHHTWLISSGAGSAFLADGLLTGVLVNLLHTQRTGVKRMDRIVDTLIVYGINTGLLTGVVTLGSLLFSLICPNNLIYAGFAIVATKMYANSLLAALNTRSSLRSTASPEQQVAGESRSRSWSGRGETTVFEMQGQVVTVPPSNLQKVEVVENSQAFLAFELVGIAV